MRTSDAIKVLMLSMVILQSCSIREDRSGCPCCLDVVTTLQPEDVFPSGKAWCSVWADGSENVGDHVFSPVAGDGGIFSLSVRKNPSTAVVVSNIEPENNRVAAVVGQQMQPLYVSRHDVDCTGEDALAEFDSLSKQYVVVKFRLDDKALPFRDHLTVNLDGPYDGLSIPSMAAHRGTFSCSSTFNENNEMTLRIPPQAGPGLKVGIRLDSNPPAIADLYTLMLDAGFGWEDVSLGDFVTQISLNSITGIIEFSDWNMVTLEDKKY